MARPPQRRRAQPPRATAAARPPPRDRRACAPQCVVNEGLRLLLGGPLREPWPCPYASSDLGKAHPHGMPYDEQGRFLHPPHSVDSVYECTLATKCGMNCKNRQVQLGPTFLLPCCPAALLPCYPATIPVAGAARA